MSASSKRWYVADPIYQLLEFGSHEQCVRSLTDAPSFQRLRRISQLGLASFVFPGAVHTRFSHCLGAAHLAYLVSKTLSIPAEYVRTIVCAALLHDLGHGPFSHSFERALKAILGSRLKHEAWTQTIISNRLATALTAHQVNPEEVGLLIGSGSDGSRLPHHLKEIVSSQLDVDRMDYLCRDAHFAGVTVGQIDVQYLIRCLRIVPHGSQQTLGLTAKGVPCYEAFAFARHVMNRTVYFHKQVATFECMMEQCLRLLARTEDEKYLPAFFQRLRQRSRNRSDAAELDLQDALDSYLTLTEDQIWTALAERRDGASPLSMLSAQLLDRRPSFNARIAAGKHALLSSELKLTGFTDDQFSVRTMPSSLYEQELPEQVFVRDEGNGVPVHISERSSLLDTLRDRREVEAILVVFDPAARAAIVDVARQANCILESSQRRSSPPSARPLARTTPEGTDPTGAAGAA